MSRLLVTVLLIFAGRVIGIAQTSPYNLTWLRESVLLGGGAANGLYSLLLNGKAKSASPDDITALNSDNINLLDRWITQNYSENFDVASDYLVGTITVVPAGILLLDGAGKDWLTLSVMYAETMLSANSAAFYAKAGVRRFRPFAYNPDAPLEMKLAPDAQRSFFSQHTCISFASAMFISTVYSDYFPDSEYAPYVWCGSFAAAGAVGLFRILAGSHFTTDVLAGAAAGSLFGYIVPAMHKANADGKHGVLMGIRPTGISVSFAF
ncbi:hypothetical protein MASR2M18_04120 [Ignavibacteria bacterium]|nr:phosphatase PAP2 family protein [Bacteroidota bacterium]MCZ2133440.1 phosphatase PAP2 family protein [Bacteroidota bacterium]